MVNSEDREQKFRLEIDEPEFISALETTSLFLGDLGQGLSGQWHTQAGPLNGAYLQFRTYMNPSDKVRYYYLSGSLYPSELNDPTKGFYTGERIRAIRQEITKNTGLNSKIDEPNSWGVFIQHPSLQEVELEVNFGIPDPNNSPFRLKDLHAMFRSGNGFLKSFATQLLYPDRQPLNRVIDLELLNGRKSRLDYVEQDRFLTELRFFKVAYEELVNAIYHEQGLKISSQLRPALDLYPLSYF